LPRIRTDFPCADKYQQTGSDLAISKDKTLDIATWNVAWFGDETNSPQLDKLRCDTKKLLKLYLQR
jgi:hypothetical protein